MFGGFVEWVCGCSGDPFDSVSKQVFHHTHWPDLRVVVVQVSSSEKSVSSSEGMKRSFETSDFLKLRVGSNQVAKRMNTLKMAIEKRDFETFSLIAMKESNCLHAICQDTFPPIEPPYMCPTSHKIVQFVHALNALFFRTVCSYTFDAGPNAFIFLLEPDIKLFFSFFLSIFSYKVAKDPAMSRVLTDYKVEIPCKDHTKLNLEPCPSDKIESIYLCKVGSGPIVVDNSGSEHFRSSL